MGRRTAGAGVRVRGPGGLVGTLVSERSLGGTVTLALADGRHVSVPEEAVWPGDGGDGEWRLDGAVEAALGRPGGAAEVVVPVVAERVLVGKRRVETGGVEVRVENVERRGRVEASLGSERVEVERVAIGRVLAPGEPTPDVRQEGDVTVVPVLREELVVTRRVVLTEEVHVRRRHEERREILEVPIREQRVHVEDKRTGRREGGPGRR